jgi:hypothetical protein
MGWAVIHVQEHVSIGEMVSVVLAAGPDEQGKR